MTGDLDFFAKMKIKQPGLFCLIGEFICRGVKVIQNGSTCFKYDDIFEKNYPFPPFEYLFCQSTNHSADYCMNTTFFYLCRTSGECISKHRLFDGFIDCLDSSDENDLEAFSLLESSFMKDRYNCTISAVMRHFLGMLYYIDLKQKNVKFGFHLGDGINQCTNGADEMSLSINWQQQQCLNSNDLACFLLRDLYNTDIEEQPIHILRFNSLCDSIWDYTDGSDEYNCNRTEKYPIPDCLLLETGEIIALNESNNVAGNGHIECSGGIDERVTFACNDGFSLNERFLCNDKMKCLKPMYLCNYIKDCSDGEDENEFWCGSKHSFNSNICNPKTFACHERNDSGPCIPQEDRCHDQRSSCVNSHQDEYMCIHSRKYNHLTFEQQFFPFPQMQLAQSHIPSPWYCDRGLFVHHYGKFACLCPPSFYGYRCEKHSHRLTVIFTLKIGLIKTDLIRIKVLLINQNETIDHILITQYPLYTGKHRFYLNYPRSRYSHLRQVSNNYTVQFRLYAIDRQTVKLLSILQYHIKYSFLPNFRLAVVLRYDEDPFHT